MNVETPITGWADRLEAVCAACPRLGISHVRVVAETASTQDAAWAASGGTPGWLVVTGRQTAGRGRLGRAWVDTADKGLAMTLTLPTDALTSVGVGVAVCRAASGVVGEHAWLGLRWPNDVVERKSGRKLAGVLIEARGGVALVGIGVNVLHTEGDFDAPLAASAVSLWQLGAKADRLVLAERIVEALGEVSALASEAIVAEAAAIDTLVRTTRRFQHNQQEITGRVEAIDPDGSIRLRSADGRLIELPAATTSLVHE